MPVEARGTLVCSFLRSGERVLVASTVSSASTGRSSWRCTVDRAFGGPVVVPTSKGMIDAGPRPNSDRGARGTRRRPRRGDGRWPRRDGRARMACRRQRRPMEPSVRERPSRDAAPDVRAPRDEPRSVLLAVDVRAVGDARGRALPLRDAQVRPPARRECLATRAVPRSGGRADVVDVGVRAFLKSK